MSNPFIDLLKHELQKPLPGKDAQLLMAPESRLIFTKEITLKTKESGILIPVFIRENEFHTVLFRRPQYDGIHAGQVCFPGGKFEKEDVSFEKTAIRETWEEVGIEKDKIEILGKLSPLHIPVSDYLVHPFIGFVNYNPDFKTDPLEVEELIITPLHKLLDKQNIKNKSSNFQGQKVLIPYYQIQNNEIWGATAMIISEFIEMLQRPSFQQINWYNAGISR